MNNARLLVPRRRKLDGDVYLWLFNTRMGLLGGYSTAAPRLCSSSTPPATLTQGAAVPSSHSPGRPSVRISSVAVPLGDVSLFL